MKDIYGDISFVNEAELKKPVLLVVIDTEEEFDWSKPHSKGETDVSAMKDIHLVQRIFDDNGIVPCYVIDYPVASNPEGYSLLKEFFHDGRCSIGAHLHPWVNPPFDETVNRHNSFPGNLPRDLEYQKLKRLLDQIESTFDYRPIVYKAGRYGVGRNSASILSELGMKIDLSATPGFDYSGEGGPDFGEYKNRMFNFGPDNNMLCIPCTGGYVGFLKNLSKPVYEYATKRSLQKFRIPGVLSRIGAVERIRLSPEGFELSEMMRLTNFLINNGSKVVTLSFHSPSVTPGCTPYVRSEKELNLFLDRIKGFVDFFYEECRGVSMDPIGLMRSL